jgi:hypothetical protein
MAAHSEPLAPKKRLDSWKEIAAFFDRDERTVRRWEKERGLPVYRVPGSARGGVFAYSDELVEWLQAPNHAPEVDQLAAENAAALEGRRRPPTAELPAIPFAPNDAVRSSDPAFDRRSPGVSKLAAAKSLLWLLPLALIPPLFSSSPSVIASPGSRTHSPRPTWPTLSLRISI